jgi:hypothetical protein
MVVTLRPVAAQPFSLCHCRGATRRPQRGRSRGGGLILRGGRAGNLTKMAGHGGALVEEGGGDGGAPLYHRGALGPAQVEGKALSGDVNVCHQIEKLGRVAVSLSVEISDERRPGWTLGKCNKLLG